MSVRRSPRKTHVITVAKDEVSSTTKVKRPIKQDPDRALASIKKTKTQVVKKEEENQEHDISLLNRKDTTKPPLNWNIVYDLLETLRKKEKAPVDTMGCERLADGKATPIAQRFQTLVALMLSSQTKDTVTSVVVRKLQAELPGGLCLQDILDIDEMTLDSMIAAIGFHTKKASYLKRTAEILRDQYNGDIPDTIDGLTSLPGVGPKMGYLALQVAWDKNMGIGVDVHVHRICNRLGWVKTKIPEETRKSLQSWLPKDKWKSINPILVGYGQIICLPRGPRCDICPVSQYCPSSESEKATGSSKTEKNRGREQDSPKKGQESKQQPITSPKKEEERHKEDSVKASAVVSERVEKQQNKQNEKAKEEIDKNTTMKDHTSSEISTGKEPESDIDPWIQGDQKEKSIHQQSNEKQEHEKENSVDKNKSKIDNNSKSSRHQEPEEQQEKEEHHQQGNHQQGNHQQKQDKYGEHEQDKDQENRILHQKEKEPGDQEQKQHKHNEQLKHVEKEQDAKKEEHGEKKDDKEARPAQDDAANEQENIEQATNELSWQPDQEPTPTGNDLIQTEAQVDIDQVKTAAVESFFEGYGIAAGHAEDEFGGLGLIGVFEESSASRLEALCRLNMLTIISVLMLYCFFIHQK
ncbi:hypothetical protein [Parasitella parasitica]|uniref:Endonuclease III homolog n=1 Tax=Parasitella parasitica TaxID=35722 RepID=A0A0B7NRN6_9FUNG|nr:hypothetical protein [Parasitella parasitica]